MGKGRENKHSDGRWIGTERLAKTKPGSRRGEKVKKSEGRGAGWLTPVIPALWEAKAG